MNMASLQADFSW